MHCTAPTKSRTLSGAAFFDMYTKGNCPATRRRHSPPPSSSATAPAGATPDRPSNRLRGRRSRAGPYRRGSGDRRSRSP